MSENIYGVIPQEGNVGRRAVVLTADKFEDFELYVPIFRLIEAGWKADVAAPGKGKITGESNWYFYIANKTIDEIDPDDYDFLFVPGGKPGGAPSVIRKNKKAQEIAQSFFAKNKPVAAICHGPWLLADAGVIRNRKLTSYWGDGVPESIKDAGGIWVDEPAVRDGNLVTSRWPMDLSAFSRELMGMLNELR